MHVEQSLKRGQIVNVYLSDIGVACAIRSQPLFEKKIGTMGQSPIGKKHLRDQ